MIQLLFIISSNIGFTIVLPFFRHSAIVYLLQFFSLPIVGKGHHQKRVHYVSILLLDWIHFVLQLFSVVQCSYSVSFFSCGIVTLNPFQKIWDMGIHPYVSIWIRRYASVMLLQNCYVFITFNWLFILYKMPG